MNSLFKDFFDRHSPQIETTLDFVLQKDSLCPAILHEAMNYAVFPGGKRIRPILSLAVSEAFSGSKEAALWAGGAIELIHSYSLVHDDLPCMDDDDIRRGKPSAHKQFGYATALLAGDALLTKAFEMVSQIKAPSNQIVQIVALISKAAGSAGMVGGQVLDMFYENKDGVSEDNLYQIHRLKTGALLSVCCQCGGIVSNCDATALAHICEYGEAIGLAFQIADDLLDACGETEKIGKLSGKDKEANKLTFVKLYGVSGAQQRAEQAIMRAKNSLEALGVPRGVLHEIADYIIERDW